MTTERPDRMWFTMEGYVVYETDSLDQVVTLCQENESIEAARRIRSCAFWMKDKLPPPDAPCYMVVWRDHIINGESLLRHEYKHCLSGAYHAKGE